MIAATLPGRLTDHQIDQLAALIAAARRRQSEKTTTPPGSGGIVEQPVAAGHGQG
jgi:hypothetical protein